MMDEICEDQGAYHSKDMITVDNGADKPASIVCGYHELRRHMRRYAAEREQLRLGFAPWLIRAGGGEPD